MATVFELLEREWMSLAADERLVRRRPDLRAAAGGAGTVGDVEAFVRGAAPAEADRVLLCLVRGAVEGDEVAARVLLQLLLPGTRSLARRWWALGDQDERAAAAVAAVYQRIRSYPLERRPGRVAANILMDAAQQLRRSLRDSRVLLVPDPVVPGARPLGGGSGRPGPPSGHAAVELTEALSDAVADGVIGAADAELIARSRIAGERVADLAAARGLTARTLWDRRQRAERSLSSWGRATQPA